MKSIIVFSIIILFCVTAWGQPVIQAGGVMNIASMAPDGLPNSGIAQGSIFIVTGTGLGAPNPNPLNLFQNTMYPLPTANGLNGTAIEVFAGRNGWAIMLYESDTMLVAIMPSNTQTGSAFISVTYNGQTSSQVLIHVVPRALGLFQQEQLGGNPGAGFGPALIQQLDPSGNFILNNFDHSATPGQTILIYGTGLGPIGGDESQGPPTTGVLGLSALSFQVYIGNQIATFDPSTDYVGRFVTSSGTTYAGVDIIEVQVPNGVQGCYVPITVVNNGVSSNVTTMSIDPGGSFCSDALIGYSQADFQQVITDQAARFGTISVNSVTLTGIAQDGSTVTNRSDGATATFVNMTPQQFHGAPSTNASPGGCIVVPFAGTTPPLSPATLGTALDAGPLLNLNGPDGAQQLTQNSGQVTYAALNSNNAAAIDPGPYSLDNGGGGADVGAFQGSFNVPAGPQWTNAAAMLGSQVPTDHNLPITWTGGDPGSLISILGVSIDAKALKGALFTCSANSDAGQFTVPSYILSWLPSSSTSVGLLAVTTLGQSRFQAPGLEVGYFNYQIGSGIAVQFTPRNTNVKE